MLGMFCRQSQTNYCKLVFLLVAVCCEANMSIRSGRCSCTRTRKHEHPGACTECPGKLCIQFLVAMIDAASFKRSWIETQNAVLSIVLLISYSVCSMRTPAVILALRVGGFYSLVPTSGYAYRQLVKSRKHM